MQVFRFVADLVERGQPGADMKVHVSEECVLRDMEANGDGRGIAFADLEVDVAHRRIKRSGIGVGNGVIWRNAARRREWNAARYAIRIACARTREHDHDAHTFLKAGRVVGEHENRARGSIAKHAYAGPYIDSVREPIPAGGKKDDALAHVVLSLVDRGL